MQAAEVTPAYTSVERTHWPGLGNNITHICAMYTYLEEQHSPACARGLRYGLPGVQHPEHNAKEKLVVIFHIGTDMFTGRSLSLSSSMTLNSPSTS